MLLESIVVVLAVFSAPRVIVLTKAGVKKLPALLKKREGWEASLKEGELLPGVVKPTTTLAHIIAAKILTDDITVMSEKLWSKDFTMNWRTIGYTGVIRPGSIETSFGVTFAASEEKILKTAIEKRQKLDARRKEIAKATKNQEAAITVIEKVMGIDKVKKPDEEYKDAPEILSIQRVKS